MRIHTDLTLDQMREALRHTQAPIGFEHIVIHGSRKRTRAFDVRLNGSGGRSNTGLYGAGNYSGATWDEWGAFLGAVYLLDPDMTCQPYPLLATFDEFTRGRFSEGVIPKDTHPRHRWSYDPDLGLLVCTYGAGKCSAVLGWRWAA